MTPFQIHVERYGACRLCELHQTRLHIVLARGVVPCDVLFIGEAPGEIENVSGDPFVGEAGQLLDSIIHDAFPGKLVDGQWQYDLAHAFTNVVCCIPRDPEKGGKLTEPLPEHVKACAPRLREFVEICEPKLIVAVGKIAEEYLDPKMVGSSWHEDAPKGRKTLISRRVHKGAEIPRISIQHPASILRKTVIQKETDIRRATVTLRNGLDEFGLIPD